MAVQQDEAIGFIGLGALGTPIAANLLASGKTVTVFNRTASKADPLVEKGARRAQRPADAVPRGGVVFTILWDDASLEEMVESEGFLDALGDGGVHVSMTTVTPETARKMARRHESRGSVYVEAPIFGVPAAAVARQLLICLAGPEAAKSRVRPLLEAMGAARIFDFGDVGGGTATKLAGNYLIVSAFGALQEAFAALKQNGIDPKASLEMLTTTIAATPGNQRMAGMLLSGNPLPRNGIPLKDVGLFQRFAQAGHASTPLAEGLREFLASQAK